MKVLHQNEDVDMVIDESTPSGNRRIRTFYSAQANIKLSYWTEQSKWGNIWITSESAKSREMCWKYTFKFQKYKC